MRNVKCPHCGESYYMENHSTSTCMYFPPIYKDGMNINSDRNIYKTYCTCMNCNKDFSYDSNGKIDDINYNVDTKHIDIGFTDEDVNNLFGQ